MTALPPPPSAPGDRSAGTVGFCPSPPLLVPAREGRAEHTTTELRRACAKGARLFHDAAPFGVGYLAAHWPAW